MGSAFAERHRRYFQSIFIRRIIKGSNAIEGIVTTDDRIRDIVNGSAPVTHDELEISGYKDALNIIHTNYENIDIDEDIIRMFHRLIEEGTNASVAGEYKKTSNFIMEYGPNGTRRVRFKPVSPGKVPENVEQLLMAYYDARQISYLQTEVGWECASA